MREVEDGLEVVCEWVIVVWVWDRGGGDVEAMEEEDSVEGGLEWCDEDVGCVVGVHKVVVVQVLGSVVVLEMGVVWVEDFWSVGDSRGLVVQS